MKTLQPIVLLLLASLLAVPAVAQEEDEFDEGFGSFYVEIGTWVAQASGLEFQAATLNDPLAPFATEILEPTRGTESELRYRLGYALPKKLGTFMATLYHHGDDNLGLKMLSPGEFVYGTLWSPELAGFANDGLADGFEYSASDALRDYRLDFYREAFRSARGGGSWFVGVRKVSHSRRQEAAYFAVLPDRPALPPEAGNRPDLLPVPDFASVGSSFDGRGFEAGFEFDVALAGDSFRLEGGMAVATLRGDLKSDYRAQTSVYTIDLPDDGMGKRILDPSEYDLIGQTFQDGGSTLAYADFVEQEILLEGIQDQSGRELASSVVDVWLGLRITLWRYFDLLGGFRQSHYSNVGVDITTSGETSRSATYEGFYGAVSARF